MGIPSYFSHLVKSYKGVLRKVTDAYGKVDNLYMDSNSIIYDCGRLIEYDGNDVLYQKRLIEAVCLKIEEYITLLGPTFALVAFDGVAPVAKLEQQRNRRYKTWLEGEITKHMEGQLQSAWCTASITPGTAFMDQLASRTTEHFATAAPECMVKISSSREPGEGEHKIFEYIRNRADEHKHATSVIYGLDADLIMLTLNHLHVSEGLYLFRETPHFIRSVDKDLDPEVLYCIDIPALARAIQSELAGNHGDELDMRRVHDYIVLCFLLGNDYMPHFPALNIRTTGVEHVLEAYRSTLGTRESAYMTKGDQIIWKAVREVIEFLKGKEMSYLSEEHATRTRMAKRATIKRRDQTNRDLFQLLPLKDRGAEVYISPTRGEESWKARYYNVLFDCDYNEERVKYICIRYLEALEWTYAYYRDGCIDWRWCYPYHYAPLLCDLVRYVPHFLTTMVERKPKNPIDAETQLCYVLPRPYHNLLSVDTANILKYEFGNCYKTEWEMRWAYCKYFWESHADMPPIDIDLLQDRLRGHTTMT